MATSQPRRASGPRRGLRRAALLAVLLIVVAVAVPSTRARLKAYPTLADAIDLIDVRPLAAPVTSTRTHVGGVAGRLDTPGWAAPAIVLVPGATPNGVDDPRARSVATALARAGRTVFTPELALYGWRLDEGDIAAIRAAARVLHTDTGTVTLLGFSFGGSLALLAAADLDVVAQVAVFGAYVDLFAVIAAATTGVASAGEVTIAWQPADLVDAAFESFIASLLDADRAAEISAVLAGELAPAALDADAGRVYALLANDDPSRVAALTERLPAAVHATLRRFSPTSVAAQVDADVVALHSRDDAAVPYTELVRLSAEFPGARVATLTSFSHVDPTAEGLGGWLRALPDAARTARFLGWVLASGEPALPATLRRLG